MRLSRRETIRFYTDIGIRLGLALAAGMLMFWLTASAVAWLGDMRHQIREEMERDRRSQHEHDTFIVHERQAHTEMLRDARDARAALQREHEVFMQRWSK